MNKTIIIAIVVLLVLVGAFFALNHYIYVEKQADLSAYSAGTYDYTCTDGTALSLSMTEDMSSILVTPQEGHALEQHILTRVGDGNQYEADGLVLVGAGEEVTITGSASPLVCNPVPSQDLAPFNWGDAGEGGSVKPDTVLVVSESIVGKWQQGEDTRELRDDGTVIDAAGGDMIVTGTWKAFTKEKPIETAIPLEPNAVYLELRMQDGGTQVYTFKIAKLTPETLELVYMERGGVLTYTFVE